MSLSHHQASCGQGLAVFISVSPWPAHSRCSRDYLLNNMEAKNLSLEGFGDQAKVSLPLRTLVHRGEPGIRDLRSSRRNQPPVLRGFSSHLESGPSLWFSSVL